MLLAGTIGLERELACFGYRIKQYDPAMGGLRVLVRPNCVWNLVSVQTPVPEPFRGMCLGTLNMGVGHGEIIG